MKINIAELSHNKVESTTNAINMRLSEHAQTMVFQLFTKNVYSNPIGTIVREITSNCFDSHVEAGVNAPVIIKLHTDNNTNTKYISFFDFGVGISPDRMINIYGVYFESTKRNDNTQIGGFGIGCKVPLAYKRSTGAGEGEYDNSFYVITTFNGIKYYYCIYEGQNSPVISLLHEEETTDGNGTEVRVPVLDKDIDSFSKEMVRQLYYFENVIFEGFEEINRYEQILTNSYQIIRGKNFLFRGNDYSDYIHICLGRVAYPIDYNVLGLYSGDYRLPVAIRLEVGDINVTVSRESIDYSETTIKMLKKKLDEVKKEIVNMLVKQYENIVTLEQYFNVKNDFGKLFFSNGGSMYIGNLIKQSDISFSNFAYQVLKMPNDKQLFKLFFDVQTFGKKPTRSRYSSKYEFSGGYQELHDNQNILYIEDEFQRKVLKQAYLKSKHEMYHIIKRRDLTKSMLISEIKELFNVNLAQIFDPATGKLDPFVETLLGMQDEYFAIVRANAECYDTLEVPADFIEDRKKRRVTITTEMRKLTIPVKFVGYRGRERVKLDYLFNYKMPIFWGTADDEIKLNNASSLFGLLFNRDYIVNDVHSDGTFYTYNSNKKANKKTSIMFIMLAQNNVKYMQYCQKAYHIREFKWRMAYRKENVVRQYFQTNSLIEKYNKLGEFYTDKDFNLIDETWGKRINELNNYIKLIPAKVKDSDIGNKKSLLEKYYDLSNIELTLEQKRIIKLIEDIEFLKEANRDVINWICVPSSLRRGDEHLYKILKNIMIL